VVVPPGEHQVVFGAARIIANQSAIVTPISLDGRVETMLRNSSVSKPTGCGFSCITCLSSAWTSPLVLCPFLASALEFDLVADPERALRDLEDLFLYNYMHDAAQLGFDKTLAFHERVSNGSWGDPESARYQE